VNCFMVLLQLRLFLSQWGHFGAPSLWGHSPLQEHDLPLAPPGASIHAVEVHAGADAAAAIITLRDGSQP
jgi:hypothetical protein